MLESIRLSAGALRPFSKIALLSLLLLPLATCNVSAQTTSQDLDSGWHFRLLEGDAHAKEHHDATHWHGASVPGTVQTDLMAAKLLPDPFYRDNEARVQWVGLSDWQYETTFTVDKATLARDHVELVFDGLDTFADVYLNGQKLASADNMFRRWRVPVKSALHEGSNTLQVRLYSPIKRLLPWLLKQPYALPGEFDSAFGDEPKGKQTANYVRKAAYQYGWDWGPRIVTEGIWQPVHLDSWNSLRVDGFHLQQNYVSAEAAQVAAQFEVLADASKTVHVSVDAVGPDGQVAAHAEQDVTVDPGSNTVSLPLRIANPRRWYPAGYGAQDMYTFKASVRDGSSELYNVQRATGLRSIELRRDKDAWGKGFAFVINGIPVFAKGADMIPFDSFPPRATNAQMQRVLQSARDANMNMVRIWGGGYYMPDAFYEMTDRLGLMVWQDFMFGGAIPPSDTAFVENTRQEAVEQVKRLRDHPSIVLWCGNNEVETGWDSWGDRVALKKAISGDEREKLVTGMVNLFSNTLRNVVMQYDPTVPYWASTPSTDYEGPANVLYDGDYHYWNVWSGDAKPVTEYLNVTPRFQSEYGLQSFPEMRTIRAFTQPGDLQPESPVMRAHQKFDSGNGNKRLLLYITRSYGDPKDFESFVYLSQVMQAEGIQLDAEHLRASRPQAMGSLYWQLNDVWPGASWSSIDYFGRWKALQFHARRFYAPLMIAALRNNGTTTVSLVSDSTTPATLHWRMRTMDFSGKVLSTHEEAASLAALSSTKVAGYTDAQLLNGADPHATFAVFELLDGDNVVSQNLVFFDEAKTLALPVPKIHTSLASGTDGYALTLSSDTLARDVWISFGDLDAEVSDNSFDLLPGQSVTVTVHDGKAGLDKLQHALRVQDLAGVMKATH
ncbi:beta-mannosidase [Dyella nitratireducens]|uniref:Beta-mannosidase B n=1 Tax=Dyella nitratireducens TaxID=1849580 RepID=A0ABQ1FVN4_9GAMM|nr:glycoside hydrolase family 2 protein [Dyella nitratireducens]GGA30250.1 beta-mannosidase [Dyella nitratireducens]GLQ43030.1 beta-mannosidase [Dyella nitratireducens]